MSKVLAACSLKLAAKKLAARSSQLAALLHSILNQITTRIQTKTTGRIQIASDLNDADAFGDEIIIIAKLHDHTHDVVFQDHPCLDDIGKRFSVYGQGQSFVDDRGGEVGRKPIAMTGIVPPAMSYRCRVVEVMK